MRSSAVVAALLTGHLAAGAVGGADWPAYRGPAGTGTVSEDGLLSTWGEGEPREAWRRSIGGGYSGVVAGGGRVFTMDTDGAEEAVLAFDAATGEPLWRAAVGPFVQAELGDGGPRSTPTVAGGVVYAVSSQARLVALAAADGAERWSRDLTELGPVPRFGYSASPLVDGELLILEVGGPDEEPGVAAFDRATGATRWTALAGPAGYSTPVAVEIAGVRQYVFSRGRSVVALSTAGEELWRHETPPRTAIPMPILLPPDRFFVSTSDDHFGGRVIRVVVAGDGGFTTEEVWSERLMRNHFNSSVLVDGHLYGFDNGTFRCLDAATGERRWARRGFGKGSLVAAGELLFVLGDDGTVALVHADPADYREAGRRRVMEGRAWTSPSLADGRLYVRDFDELVALDLRATGADGGGGAVARDTATAPAEAGEGGGR